MTEIPDDVLNTLRGRGLTVVGPFPAAHASYPDGWMVGKPGTVKGNRIHGCKYYGERNVVYDIPGVTLHLKNQKWYVEQWLFAPGPGPTDFFREYETPAEAIDDILRYFVGEDPRVQKYIEFQARRAEKLKKIERERRAMKKKS